MQGTNLAESLSAFLNKRKIMDERLRGFARTGETNLTNLLRGLSLPCFIIIVIYSLFTCFFLLFSSFLCMLVVFVFLNFRFYNNDVIVKIIIVIMILFKIIETMMIIHFVELLHKQHCYNIGI